MRIGVLLSGSGRTLQNFINLRAAGQLPVEIAVVGASKAAAMGLQRARNSGVPTFVANRAELQEGEFDGVISSLLRLYEVDLVCMAGFLCLWQIPADFAGRVINIHPALLPKYGGPRMYGDHVHRAVLAAGEKVSGCTVHFADNEYDHGPIIDQRTVSVLPDDTPDSLAARVFEAEMVLYPDVIRRLAEGRIAWGSHSTTAKR